MSQYYTTQPSIILLQTNTKNPAENATNVLVLSEFNKLWETLLTSDAEEGWASELCQYLSTVQ